MGGVSLARNNYYILVVVIVAIFVLVVICDANDDSSYNAEESDFRWSERRRRRAPADDRVVENGGNCTLAEMWNEMAKYEQMLRQAKSVRFRRGRSELDGRVEKLKTGLLWNCSSAAGGGQEELSIGSLTALCHAQCTANCADSDCADTNCTLYKTEEWSSLCDEDDYECLKTCSQNNTDSAEEAIIPKKPTTLTLYQVTPTLVRITWTPSENQSSENTVIYVTEGTAKPSNSWTVYHQSSDPWTEVYVDVCTVMAFRVAAVNQYGSEGFTTPIVRIDLPAPGIIREARNATLVSLKDLYFHYGFKFFTPEDWMNASPRVLHPSKDCSTTFNVYPPPPSQGEFKLMEPTTYLYQTQVHERGLGCIYTLQFYLESPCGIQGPPYTTYINLTSCENIQGYQCPDPGQGVPENGQGSGSTTTTASVTTNSTMSTPDAPVTIAPSSGNSAAVISASVLSAVAAAAGVLILIGCILRRRSRAKKVAEDDFQLTPIKLQKPFLKFELDNILYKTREHYTDIIRREEWEISRDSLVLGEILGHGAFGMVRKGSLRVTDSFLRSRWSLDNNNHPVDMTVAVKMLIGDHIDLYRQDFLREMELMKSIGYHGNVVSMIGCCTRDDPLCLIVEHVALGDLLHFLQDYRSRCQQVDEGGDFEFLSIRDLFHFAKQIATGMEFLALKGFVHRDLAARNVLVGHEKKVKIGDFGLTRYIYDDQVYVTNRAGKLPLKWMAIESIFDLTFTSASDVWSFGVVLYELVTLGGTPYPTTSHRELLRELQRGYRMERPVNCSPELYRLMIDCWQARPTSRPTFTALCKRIEAMAESLALTESCVKVIPMDGILYENTEEDNSGTGSSVIPVSYSIVENDSRKITRNVTERDRETSQFNPGNPATDNSTMIAHAVNPSNPATDNSTMIAHAVNPGNPATDNSTMIAHAVNPGNPATDNSTMIAHASV